MYVTDQVTRSVSVVMVMEPSRMEVHVITVVEKELSHVMYAKDMAITIKKVS